MTIRAAAFEYPGRGGGGLRAMQGVWLLRHLLCVGGGVVVYARMMLLAPTSNHNNMCVNLKNSKLLFNSPLCWVRAIDNGKP